MPQRAIGLSPTRVIGVLGERWLAGFSLFILIGISTLPIGPSYADPLARERSHNEALIRRVNDQGDLVTASDGLWRLALLDRPRTNELRGWNAALSALFPAGSTATLDKGYQDRWGLQVGLIQGSRSAQTALVEQGLAVVNPLLWRAPNDPSLAKALPPLLAAEQHARAAERGLWAKGGRQVEPASGLISTDDGLMHIVQGAVHSVSEVRNIWYLNFGVNWRRDFTVRLDKAQAKAWEKSQAIPLASLKGRQVRVRGWPRWANGPLIELTSPYMLEVLAD